MIDSEFLSVLFKSRSFWQFSLELVPAALCCAVLLLLLGFRSRRRADLSSLHRSEAGTAAAVDLVLTLPIALAIVLVVVQIALLFHASIVVHYSAYASARSARVWYWDRDTAFIEGLGDVGMLANNMYAQDFLFSGQRRADAMCRVRAAAKFALIPIAPAHHPNVSNGNQILQMSCGREARSIVPALANLGASPSTDEVRGESPIRFGRPNYNGERSLVRKARYAFDDVNTRVSVDPLRPDVDEVLGGDDPNLQSVIVGVGNTVDTLKETFSQGNAWRVRSEVQHRYWLVVPFASALFGDYQSEGFHARWIKAEVVLL